MRKHAAVNIKVYFISTDFAVSMKVGFISSLGKYSEPERCWALVILIVEDANLLINGSRSYFIVKKTVVII